MKKNYDIEFFLKTNCQWCHAPKSVVVTYYDDEKNVRLVDCGACNECSRPTIMSTDPYYEFISRGLLENTPIEILSSPQIKNLTLGFTGYRPDKLGGYDLYSEKNIEIGKKMQQEFWNQYNQGKRIFFSGFALGADIMWVAVIDKLREKHSLQDVLIFAAIPFRNQWIKWQKQDVERYFYYLSKSDAIFFVDELEGTKYYSTLAGLGNFHPAKMLKRNEFMVDFSTGNIVAVWNGIHEPNSGTSHCVKYSQKQGRNISQIIP